MAAIKATGKTGGLDLSLDLLEKYLSSKYNVKKAFVESFFGELGEIEMDHDWRLANHERYLLGKTLVKAQFKPVGLRDHAHCAFCWEKFGINDDWLQVGYCTTDRNWWIGEQCFSDFREKFQWILQP